MIISSELGVGMERVAVTCCDEGIAYFQHGDPVLAEQVALRREAAQPSAINRTGARDWKKTSFRLFRSPIIGALSNGRAAITQSGLHGSKRGVRASHPPLTKQRRLESDGSFRRRRLHTRAGHVRPHRSTGGCD